MIRDLMRRELEIIGESNGHMLTYGTTGKGKTFFLNRQIEAHYIKGKRVLIIDFSGSYTEEEMRKNNFKFPDRVRRLEFYKRPLQWNVWNEDQEMLVKDISDAIYNVLDCHSYNQKKILMKAIAYTMEREGKVSISSLVLNLEDMLAEEQEKDKAERTVGYAENIQRLLTRLYPYSEIDNLRFVQGDETSQNYFHKAITILDLTSFPEIQRRFLTELLISVFWREMYRQEQKNRCDVLILDEMQFLSLKEHSTLSCMLREGRKKGLEVMLSTQYIGHYNKSELRALQQVDNLVIFRPTPEDYRRSAQMIDFENSNVWMEMLGKLRRGEAVLKGSFRLKGQKTVHSGAILIKIEK